jgi:hypothetical protein
MQYQLLLYPCLKPLESESMTVCNHLQHSTALRLALITSLCCYQHVTTLTVSASAAACPPCTTLLPSLSAPQRLFCSLVSSRSAKPKLLAAALAPATAVLLLVSELKLPTTVRVPLHQSSSRCDNHGHMVMLVFECQSNRYLDSVQETC